MISFVEIVRNVMGENITRSYLREHLRQYARDARRQDLVLDIGSGTSPYKQYFTCATYLAMDLEPNPNTCLVADACHIPVQDGTVDLVVCTEVLEHVANSQGMISEIRRILKPEGYLVLSTPLLWGVHGENDYHRWTEKGLTEFLCQSGFRILRLRKRGGILAAVGELIGQIPVQILIDGGAKTALWRRGLFVGAYMLWLPFGKSLKWMDFLDGRKNFTLGYSVLCEKESRSYAGENLQGHIDLQAGSADVWR